VTLLGQLLLPKKSRYLSPKDFNLELTCSLKGPLKRYLWWHGEMFRYVLAGYRALNRPVRATRETMTEPELANGTGQDMMDYSPSRTENHEATRGGE